MSDIKKLTPKQQKFCEEYMVDLNGKQAAIRAGYSEKTANVIAVENLTKPTIVKKITELKEGVSDKTQIKVSEVVGVLAEIMRDEDAKGSDRINASDKLLKHLGGYELNNQQKKPVIDISGLTTEQLVVLVQIAREQPNQT